MRYEDLTIDQYQEIKDRCKESNPGRFDNGVTLYNCPCCQKDFAISYVDGWTYKRRTRSHRKNESILYFCSYSCIRIYDKIFG